MLNHSKHFSTELLPARSPKSLSRAVLQSYNVIIFTAVLYFAKVTQLQHRIVLVASYLINERQLLDFFLVLFSIVRIHKATDGDVLNQEVLTGCLARDLITWGSRSLLIG